MSVASWRVARVTPLGELNQPGRITANAARLAVQLFLVVMLWRALYATVERSGGLTREQAVTYAVLAILTAQLHYLGPAPRDSVLQHMRMGTIIYWFLRPLSARRYYLIRAVGAQAYGLAWTLTGYLFCLAIGWITRPASAASAVVFVVSMALGQVLTLQIVTLVDLVCFWTLQNESALLVVRFLQALLSGALAPLWFFPDWFRTLSWVLPFRYTLDVPVSFYVGRLTTGSAPLILVGQVLWCAAVYGLNRWLWRRAAERITVQGG